MRHMIHALAALAVCAGPPAFAEAPGAFPDFKAKRVTPPKAGDKRITVQIAPRANPAVPPPRATTTLAAVSPVTPAVPRAKKGEYDWFWTVVSPAMDTASPARLEPALIKLGNPPGGSRSVRAPRLQHMQDIAEANGVHILRSTIGTRVSPALVLAVISVESAGRADAVSRAGAQGLMQLMPATAARFGVNDSLVPAENIRGGVAYLDFLMKKFNGDPILVLAGYNAGEGAVTRNNGVPPFAETRDYVPKVLAAFNVAKGLCKTPPQLASDGCVFSVSAS